MEGSRGVAPVIGVVLLVAITVLLAAAAGAMVYTFGENEPQAPLQASLTIQSVEKSADNITIAVDDEDVCADYHVVVTMEHRGGETLDSGDLEYVVEVSGDEGTTLSGRFNESVATPGVTASAGDEIVLGLDSDTDAEGPCDAGGVPEASNNTVVFGGEPAWDPEEASQVGDLWKIHDTYLDENNADDTLTEVRVRIVHLPSETVVIDETEDDIVDLDE